jgi:mannose-1-phosphate guanylyltransferase/mannose-6-phosphate isomerase
MAESIDVQVGIVPIILCGGSGTRLWPLSRQSFPKQFISLIDGKSLLTLTAERLSHLSSAALWAVGAEDHRFLIADALATSNQSNTVILEPVARNTTAAIALAALALHTTEADPYLLFCPADHHIPDTRAFVDTVHTALPAAANGEIVMVGISPTYPATGYGYIQAGEAVIGGIFKVDRFIEKPDLGIAESLLLAGKSLWNAGIFFGKASRFIEAIQSHAPDIMDACRTSMLNAKTDRFDQNMVFLRPNAEAFSACRSVSIDYAVMEHHKSLAMVPFSGLWSDVGSWKSLADMSEPDSNGNTVQGDAWLIDTKQTFIRASDRPIVTIDVQGLLIVDTPDALLVANKLSSERVKEAVAVLESAAIPQAVTHQRVARPWGWYDSIGRGGNFQVKRIGVRPGAALSLQRHQHRAEHWIVVRGRAEVTVGSQTFSLPANESTYIPRGTIHRLENASDTEIEIIEIQTGEYLEEDDIERLDDVYGRN